MVRTAQGKIAHCLLANAEGLENTVTIQPNPNQGEFQFSFISLEPADIRIEMLNTLGQSVYNEQSRNFEGMFRKEMDLKAQSNGIYYRSSPVEAK